jgi:hypothetical protein
MGLVRICVLPAGVLSRFFFFRHKIIRKTEERPRYACLWDTRNEQIRKISLRIMLTSNPL